MKKRRILFLCTHNSARSQMAEGLLRHLAADRFEAYSAGTEATRVRPLAIRAMAELEIDISAQASKTLERYLGAPFDAVITISPALVGASVTSFHSASENAVFVVIRCPGQASELPPWATSA